VTSIDHHQLAAISIIGSFLDVLGALYLAYDILGGKTGPLRALTRGVTYGIFFGVGYGLALGLAFGIAAGIAHGITLAFELTRASRMEGRFPIRYEVLFSVIRGVGFGVGASWIHGWEFGLVFGALSTAGQIAGYRVGMFPGVQYKSDRSLRLTPRQLFQAVMRTAGYGIAGYVSAAVAHHQMHALMFGEYVGISTGIVTAIFNFVTPYVEWLSDNMPDRRMGVVGVVLILFGFSMQSLQYWVALFDVQLR
jgi:hypothetical protein